MNHDHSPTQMQRILMVQIRVGNAIQCLVHNQIFTLFLYNGEGKSGYIDTLTLLCMEYFRAYFGVQCCSTLRSINEKVYTVLNYNA